MVQPNKPNKMKSLSDSINNYVFLNSIDSGCSGVVGKYVAVNSISKNQNEEVFAIKTLDKAALISSQNEISILLLLSHPNIVKCVNIFEENERSYIVLELSEIGNLATYSLLNPLTAQSIYAFMIQILNALDYLHNTCKIIHRDIKLKNILVWHNSCDNSITLKLCDFGISIQTDIKQPCNSSGTVLYMAPEVMAWKEHSFPVDIWGLGICMYCLLEKRYPFNINIPEGYNKPFEHPTVSTPYAEPMAMPLVGRILMKVIFTVVRYHQTLFVEISLNSCFF